jgi:hypothetical protein
MSETKSDIGPTPLLRVRSPIEQPGQGIAPEVRYRLAKTANCFNVRGLDYQRLLATNLREHMGVFVLASLSNGFLTLSQYVAVSAAVSSYLPVDAGTSALISSYGRGPGILLALFLNYLVFEGILAVLVVTLALSAIVNTGWRWPYAFASVIVSGFVGYWLGAKFLVVLEWISILQNNRVDISGSYSSLFWFGLAASICYVLMVLFLRKSYGRLGETRLPVGGPP